MAQHFVEKKVHFLGEWQNNTVDSTVISHINSMIQNEKGHKVKLQLSSDGIRIVKKSMFQGKTLQDYTPVENIKFLTVNQRMPDVLYVTALAKDGKNKLQVQVFRCANGMEAGIFIGMFKSVQKSVKTVTVKTPQNADQEEINWTLRNKGIDNSKRELKKLVDLHGEKSVVHKVPNGDSKEVSKSHTEVYENGVRIPIYRKGKPAQVQSMVDGLSYDEDHNSDGRSEVSESALRVELESLSQELRDIKLMLEKSSALSSSNSEPGSPREFERTTTREFEPMNVKVTSHAHKPQAVAVNRQEEPEQAMDAVVLDDDDEPVEMRKKQQNGYHVTSKQEPVQIRVSVPDYRSIAERSEASTVQHVKRSEPDYEVVNVKRNESGYGSVSSRTTTTSYDSWKRNTMERNAVRYGDLPERIQWKSRSSRASHVMPVRPRSALPSWSSDATDRVEVRHHNVGGAPQYQHVSFNPQVAKIHDRKTQSLRAKGISSTVVKPIHQVYRGRSDAVHGSIVYRPHSANVRQTILTRDNPHRASQTLYTEQNNNIVKADHNNDDHLLDVSGIDLYNDTPSESVVIRT